MNCSLTVTVSVILILYSIYISVEKATHSQVMLLGEELYNDRHLQSCRLIFESVRVTTLGIPPIYLTLN